MTDIDTSKEAVEAWCNSRGVLLTKPPKTPPEVEMLCALMAERDTLQAQINSPAHAARVLLGSDDVVVLLAKKSAARAYGRGYKADPSFTVRHSGTCSQYVHNNWEKYLQDAEGAIMDLRAIALDTTTATCDNTREGE